ncbi:MAG: metallophosphoesterase [Candidatus Omnitrophica bacterium]|nr:metallophosphoesterase [Candidatus Omnitrophota bacterium]
MRIGVLSDTHIPERAKSIPQKILEDFKTVDMVLHAGDLVTPEVLEELHGVCKEVHAVWGNMDPQEVRSILPQKEIIKAGRYRIGLTHGYGNPAYLIDNLKHEFKNDNVDLIVFGHSHTPFNEKKDDAWYFNPGSATDDIFASYKSYGIIELGDKIQTRIVKI